MEGLITGLQFFAGLSLLIILHELGHFLAAKYFGVRVEKFYLFFDFLFPFPEVAKFALFKKQIGETEYGIGWFPFGGYVQMSGIMDENMDKEALAQPVQEHEFRAKPAWQRLIILLGGIIVNVLVAFVIYAFIAGVWGDDYIKVEDQIFGVYVDSTGAALGLQNGDLITHVNGKEIKTANEVRMEMFLSIADNITYVRDGKEHTINGIDKTFYKNVIANEAFIATPAYYAYVDSVMNPQLVEAGVKKGDRIIEMEGQSTEYFQDLAILRQDYKGKEVEFKVLRDNDTLSMTTTLGDAGEFGFISNNRLKVTHRDYNFFQAIVAGPVKSYEVLEAYVRQMKLIFDGEIQGYRHIGGFGTIAKIYSGGFSWQPFLAKTAFISIMLAFMNLLPIPALDGGHAMFTVYEMIFRKPPPEKFMYYAQVVGMMILFGLLIYANGMDIFRALSGK